MNSPLRCSVVIPTYDCLEYLRQALATVAMQDVEGIETIVVDDGSTDGTGQWLREYAAICPRLRVIELPGSSGPSAARNAALSVASGRMIAFLDADDLWWPGKLRKQLDHHEADPDVTFSFTDYVHFDPDGILHGTCFDFWKPAYAQRTNGDYRVVPNAEFEILAANVVGTSTVVASAKSLQNANGFPEDSQSAEDWRLWLKLAARGKVSCSSTVTMSYLMRPTSVTSNRLSRINSMREIVGAYAGRTEPEVQAACRRAMARIRMAEAEYHRQQGSRFRAAVAHADAFLKWPDRRTARAVVADARASLFSFRRA